MIGRDILGIEDLSREDIETILETAERMVTKYRDQLRAH